MSKIDYLAFYRGTFGPDEPLPEWLRERDELEAMQATLVRLRQSRERVEQQKAARKPRRRMVNVRRAPAWRPAAPARRMQPPSIAAARGASLIDTRAPASDGGWHYPARTAIAVPRVEVRASGSSAGVLSGYAAMYGHPSVNLGGFVETLAPGAFRSTLARIKSREHDLFLLTEHTQQNILARVTAGNLRVEEDAVGLRFTVELPDTQLGRDVRELVGRGILRGMSFSFSPIKDTWPDKGKRVVHDLTAYEISIVSSPAYPATSVMANRAAPDATSWQVARLRALSARPTRATISRPAVRSTTGIEWR
jgi:uncharacterized protein